MIVALTSLQVLVFEDTIENWGDAIPFPFIMKASDRAPHLEYLGNLYGAKSQYWKRVSGEWVICDKAEFPSIE
jgi:hypothetical protein